MSLSADDRKYFDEKFGELHGRITRHELDDKDSFAEVGLQVVESIRTHEKEKHNLGKLFAVLSSIVVIAAAVIGGILWLIERVGKQ